jgi:hypothetical protein
MRRRLSQTTGAGVSLGSDLKWGSGHGGAPVAAKKQV